MTKQSFSAVILLYYYLADVFLSSVFKFLDALDGVDIIFENLFDINDNFQNEKIWLCYHGFSCSTPLLNLDFMDVLSMTP